jgi:hypothetical protein
MGAEAQCRQDLRNLLALYGPAAIRVKPEPILICGPEVVAALEVIC